MLTEGEYRVGIGFNLGGNPTVDRIKLQAASLIDYVAKYGKDPRCTALAQTAFEDAAMWAVKSVTKSPKEQDNE